MSSIGDQEGCGGGIGILIVVVLYISAVVFFFQVIAPFVFGVTLVGFVGLILVNYFRGMWEGLGAKVLPASVLETPGPAQPAYKNYFFNKAYQDYRDIVRQAWQYSYNHGEKLFDLNTNYCFKRDYVLFSWPIGVTVLLVLAVGFVAGAAAFAVFGLVHLLIVSLVCAVVYMVALYFRLVERFSMYWRRISYVCPHEDCYKPIALPAYTCPSCGEKHDKLIPGSYGIFKRRCQCNKARLPTLALFGRSKIDAYCPHAECQKPLNPEIGSSTNLHIPIVGGPAAGKTNYLVASVIELEEDTLEHGRTMTFPDERDERTYKSNKQMFEQGQPVLKTPGLSPTAFSVKVVQPNKESQLLYIYDAAGELYSDADDTRRRQGYLAYTSGILFLLDPFSIEQIGKDYKKELARHEGELKPCSEPPQDVYDRMVNTLRALSKEKTKKTPIAVVVTKIDAFDLKEQIMRAHQDGETLESKGGSDAVRQWLIDKGEGNLIRAFDKDFEHVRYFSCSALGRLLNSNQGSAFKPSAVLSPLQWVLSTKGINIIGNAGQRIGWKSEGMANTFGLIAATVIFFTLLAGLVALGSYTVPMLLDAISAM